MTNALPNERAPAGTERPLSVAALPAGAAAEIRTLSEKRQASMPEFRLARESTELRVQLRDRSGVTLEPTAWIKACQDLHARRRILRREWTTLMETEAFPRRMLRLESVESTRQAHQKALSTVKLEDGLTRLGRLCGGFFIHPGVANGESMEIPGSYFDFEYISSEPATLLAAWNSKAPTPLDNAGFQSLLERLNRHFKDPEEFLDDEAPLRELAPDGVPSPALRSALDALLEAAVVADGDLDREPPHLDVRLREALRISADLHRLVLRDQTSAGQ